MFFEVHRLSVFSPRSLDVDVVLDLMIHDLDIVLAFANSRVKEVRAVGLPILSGKVDIANVRLEFESGCVANFTASRVSTERVRKVRFFQPRQYVSLDYGRQEVLVFTVAGDTESAD
jgi:predicted dehydrogenase